MSSTRMRTQITPIWTVACEPEFLSRTRRSADIAPISPLTSSQIVTGLPVYGRPPDARRIVSSAAQGTGPVGAAAVRRIYPGGPESARRRNYGGYIPCEQHAALYADGMIFPESGKIPAVSGSSPPRTHNFPMSSRMTTCWGVTRARRPAGAGALLEAPALLISFPGGGKCGRG
jgi:hypothetical protein